MDISESKQEMPSSTEENDRGELIRLIREVIGDRSYRQTASDTGINSSYISAILKGKYLPQPQTLKKFTDPASNPQNGVTYEELMIAAGFQNDTTMDSLIAVAGHIGEHEPVDEGSSDSSEPGTTPTHIQIKTFNRFEMMAKAAVSLSLIKKAVFTECECLPNERYDFSFHVTNYSGRPVDFEWKFDGVYYEKDTMINIKFFMLRVAMIAFQPPEPNVKYSLVTNSKQVFENMKRRCQDGTSIRADLSIILLNEEKLQIADEFYISHYAENYDPDTETYLT